MLCINCCVLLPHFPYALVKLQGKEQVPKLSWPGSSWKGRKKKVGHKTHSDYVDLCPGAWPEQA